MTTATEATSGTALAQVAPGALALATGRKPFTIDNLVAKLGTQPPAPVPVKGAPFPAVAPVVEITPELTAALRALPKQFGQLQVTARRILTAAEIKQLTDETITLNAVASEIGARKEAIALAIRHHADCQAEAEGRAYPASVVRGGKVLHEATARVGAGKAGGHYALASPGRPVEIVVPGYQDPWRIQHTSGKSEMSLPVLEELLKAGKIDRKEYLAMTREERVFDDGRIAKFVKENPGRALEIMAAITVTAQAGASTVSPKK